MTRKAFNILFGENTTFQGSFVCQSAFFPYPHVNLKSGCSLWETISCFGAYPDTQARAVCDPANLFVEPQTAYPEC